MNPDYVAIVEGLGSNLSANLHALVAIGPDALTEVKHGLGHPDWRVRRGCAFVIDHVWDVDALQRLTLLLHDPKKKVRKIAAHALGCGRCKEGNPPIDVIPALAEAALEDKSQQVRQMATLMLAQQQPERRIRRVLRRIEATATDPKVMLHAKWGLSRYET